ncbi:2-oxo acid dehydrogenase subunit E2 [Stappia sp. GBMRC 2046]|uniref:Dihydrolipoamide acetyltransferase component of pyruvate dehydrogenase complex n=1 Tax=Stappia sediminis TaxID=2692190 RepID=A0A7X3LS18_9HYPH|nr:dihydrolipoamide acetyltransferase family protein [Stappia sediminis]MXN64031.1 2-oxo acid dehydrogenase subunit E2 [Stappia sediminis]
MSDFKMPSLGADMDAGTLVEWLKQPGDKLGKGDVIAVVETQKGAIEIEVFHDAVMGVHLVEPGERVTVGTTIARLDDGEIEEPEHEAAAPPSALPATETLAPAAVAHIRKPEEERLKITPAARKRAEEMGIDLQIVSPDAAGVIGLAELEAAAKGQTPILTRTKAGIDPVEMRRAIAAAMARSKREIPHYYVSSDLDVTALMTWLEGENRKRPVAERLLYAVPLIRALCLSLAKTPELNGIHEGDVFRPDEAVHAGIAVSMRGGGLIAPAILNADTLDLDVLRKALADLVQRVRAGRLKSSEMTSATVTISNLGEKTADMLMPVIYPPQVAIIGCGQIRETARFKSGAWQARRVMTVTVAADHRVSDGRIAARFLNDAQRQLDHPEKL